MIPLRSTEGVEKFPRSSLILCLSLLLINLLFHILAADEFFLKLNIESLWTIGSVQFWIALILSSSFFNIWVHVLYIWVFSPQLFQRHSWVSVLMSSVVGAWLARWSFYNIHAQYLGPLFSLDAFTGVILGISLRKEIWSTVTTLVLGFGWLRVFEVPSYVLLFFWLFYLFLGNLWKRPELAEAPMLYWMPLFGLIFGFMIEGILYRLESLGRPQSPPKLDENL